MSAESIWLSYEIWQLRAVVNIHRERKPPRPNSLRAGSKKASWRVCGRNYIAVCREVAWRAKVTLVGNRCEVQPKGTGMAVVYFMSAKLFWFQIANKYKRSELKNCFQNNLLRKRSRASETQLHIKKYLGLNMPIQRQVWQNKYIVFIPRYRIIIFG